MDRPSALLSDVFVETAKLMRIASSVMDVVYPTSGAPQRGIDLGQVAQIQ